jgi:hypothetical protein
LNDIKKVRRSSKLLSCQSAIHIAEGARSGIYCEWGTRAMSFSGNKISGTVGR